MLIGFLSLFELLSQTTAQTEWHSQQTLIVTALEAEVHDQGA